MKINEIKINWNENRCTTICANKTQTNIADNDQKYQIIRKENDINTTRKTHNKQLVKKNFFLVKRQNNEEKRVKFSGPSESVKMSKIRLDGSE